MSISDPSSVSRRTFIRRTGLVTGAAILGSPSPAPADSTQVAAPDDTSPMPRRVLGRTGVPVTTFTLGTAACGSLSPTEIAKLVNVAIDEGVGAVDTSERYQNSQEGVGLALGKRRDAVFLSTKVFANSIAEAEASLAKSFRMLKTDCIDLLYYHGLGNLNIEGAMAPDGVFTWLVRQKKAGKCRFLGVSSHNLPGRCQQFFETGEVDVALVALNFVDRHTYNFEQRVLPLAREHQVGVVAMKVFGGVAGMNYKKLAPAAMPDDTIASAFRYALSLPGVATANIGAATVKEIRHNAAMARAFQPLADEELVGLLEQGKKMAADWGEHFGPVEERV